MIGYIISLVIVLLYFIFGLIYIIKKPFELTLKRRLLILAFLVSCYFLTFFETISNSNFNYFQVQMIFIIRNITPLAYLMAMIAIIIPQKSSNPLYTLLLLLVPFLVYGMIDYSYCYINTFHNFYGRFAWYLLGITTILLVVINQIKYNQNILKIRNIVIAAAILLGIYGFMILHNAIYGTNFYGLAFNENFYIYERIKVNNYRTSIVLNFVFLFTSGIISFLTFYPLQKLIAKK